MAHVLVLFQPIHLSELWATLPWLLARAGCLTNRGAAAAPQRTGSLCGGQSWRRHSSSRGAAGVAAVAAAAAAAPAAGGWRTQLGWRSSGTRCRCAPGCCTLCWSPLHVLQVEAGCCCPCCHTASHVPLGHTFLALPPFTPFTLPLAAVP